MNQKLYDENPTAEIGACDIEHIMWYVGFLRYEWKRAVARARLAEMRVKVLSERTKHVSELLKDATATLDIVAKNKWSRRHEAMIALGLANPISGYVLALSDFVRTMLKFEKINPSDEHIFMSPFEFYEESEGESHTSEQQKETVK